MLKRRSWFARLPRNRWLIGYLALLALSHLIIALRGPGAPDPPPTQRIDLDLPRMTDVGPVAGTYRLSVLRWSPPGDERTRLPVILLHGCPSGGGDDFERFAPAVAARGSVIFAPDLPSSGASGRDAPTYSILATARLMLAAMDELGIERAHIVGWSQGGGTGIHLAHLAPDRVASLTLLASIGAQDTEGSGDYFFEHFKYRLGHFFIAWLPEAIPHFGLLGSREARWTLLRPFMDTDLRPMREIMRSLRTPTLILHGRHDFLVPAWAAEKHHEYIGPSTLVMLDADHFMPIAPAMPGNQDERHRQFRQTADHLLAFLAQHEAPRAGPLSPSAAILCPADAHITEKLGGFKIGHGTPWWAVVVAIFIAAMVSEDLTIITVGLLIVSQSIDWGVALVGCFIAVVVGDLSLWMLGRTLGRRVLKWPFIGRAINEQSLEKWARLLDKHTGKTVMLSRCLPGTRLPTFIAAGMLSKKPHIFFFWVAFAAFLWTPFLLGMTMLVGPSLLDFFKTLFHGPWAIVAAIIVLYAAIRLVEYETTEQGRDRLKADLKRLITPEFWPAWAFYAPLVPYNAWLSARYGGFNPMTFSAANPGVPEGGGVIGESKSRMLASLGESGDDFVLPWVLIPEDPDTEWRANRAIEAIRDRPELGGFPIILKPDEAFRGYGLKLARCEDAVRAYFKVMTRAVMLQKYHPGPHELGVLWSRIPTPGKPVDEWPGEIFSATDKEFPIVIGDGKHTLELLIWRDKRLRMQANIFLRRFSGQTDRILAEGERMPLAIAGNHCQGTKFTDGMPKVSPALAASIDRIARAYRDPHAPADGSSAAGLDFGRFDLRYTDPEALARGEGFAIVEVNGTSSESTSMYDPHKSIWWTYRLLFGHWRRLFLIGAARRREGVKPMTVTELIEGIRRHRRHRPGGRVSD